MILNTSWTVNDDLVVGVLRKQLNTLEKLIVSFEEKKVDEETYSEDLKQIEREIKWVRKTAVFRHHYLHR